MYVFHEIPMWKMFKLRCRWVGYADRAQLHKGFCRVLHISEHVWTCKLIVHIKPRPQYAVFDFWKKNLPSKLAGYLHALGLCLNTLRMNISWSRIFTFYSSVMLWFVFFRKLKSLKMQSLSNKKHFLWNHRWVKTVIAT